MVEVPETRYARSGEVCIAHQVVGDGDRDIVLACDPSGPCDLLWDDPIVARWIRRLARAGRVVLFDVRGAGASSPLAADRMPPLQSMMDDLRLVMDEVDSATATIISPNLFAPLALMFAATHPKRTDAIIGLHPFVRLLSGDGYPHGLDSRGLDTFYAGILEVWGTERGAALLTSSRADDPAFVRWAAKAQRLAAPPTALLRLATPLARSDLRPVLSSIGAPALLLTHRDNPFIPVEHSRYLADALPDARLVELDGADFTWFSDRPDLFDHVEAFLVGSTTQSSSERVLATVLITDIVGSTAQAQSVGDDRWTSLLARHDEIVRRHVDAFGGRWIKSTGDGAIATFDAPARAVLCADGIRGALAGIGVTARAGLHTGEIHRQGDDIAGVGVHIAARVAALAEPDEVLVSATIPALVVGSTLEFDDHGEHAFKGVEAPWRVFRLTGA